MQAQKEAPPDMQCKDRFLVQSVVARPGATPKDINPEMVIIISFKFFWLSVYLFMKLSFSWIFPLLIVSKVHSFHKPLIYFHCSLSLTRTRVIMLKIANWEWFMFLHLNDRLQFLRNLRKGLHLGLLNLKMDVWVVLNYLLWVSTVPVFFQSASLFPLFNFLFAL